MTDKIFTPKKHVRIDKMGGATKECYREGIAILVDELNMTGTQLLNDGIELNLTRRGLMKYPIVTESPTPSDTAAIGED